jgi:putative membrane protein
MLWFKAFHLITMVAWFAGIFYLPRLFVYHAESADDISLARFKVMERRLYYGIMTPSMILTLIFGTAILTYNISYYEHATWLHMKLSLVALLVCYHLYCGRLLKQFALGQNTHSPLFYRWFNEFPVLILIPVILLAVFKP